MPEITPIHPGQIAEARQLIYLVTWPLFHAEMSFDEVMLHYKTCWPLPDLDDIDKEYFENGGTFLVMMEGERIIGTGGLRRMDDQICEIMRLYFLPEYHRQRLGYRMMVALLDIARERGFTTSRLSTSPKHQPRAYAFYHQMGFFDIPCYNDDPDDVGMELIL